MRSPAWPSHSGGSFGVGAPFLSACWAQAEGYAPGRVPVTVLVPAVDGDRRLSVSQRRVRQGTPDRVVSSGCHQRRSVQ